jgi:hypothetical protein
MTLLLPTILIRQESATESQQPVWVLYMGTRLNGLIWLTVAQVGGLRPSFNTAIGKRKVSDAERRVGSC